MPIALIAALIIGLSAIQYSTQEAKASKSIIGNYGQGYDDGKQAARNNYPSSDASCPLDYLSNISYCTGYHIGYNYQWGVMNLANGQ